MGFGGNNERRSITALLVSQVGFQKAVQTVSSENWE